MAQPSWPQPSQVNVAPADLRPQRRWYFVALAVFVVCTLVGVVFCVLLFSRAAEGVNMQALQPGSTKVAMRADKEKGVYAVGTVNPSDPPRCRYTGPGRLRVSRVLSSETVTYNDTTWVLVGTMRASKAGTYTVNCSKAGATKMGVGNRLGSVFLSGFGAIGVLIAGIFVGLVGGGTVALVTLAKRAGHKSRLQRAAATPAGPPPPFPPPGPPPPPPSPPAPPAR